MAFIVEDGTGLANATSYMSEAEADTHHADGGDTVWAAAATADKQAALIRATRYVDKRFGPRFRGFREGKSQALEWPRLSAFDNDDFLMSDVDRIPRNLKKCVAELALITLQIGPLLPLPANTFSTVDPATGTITTNGAGQVTRKKEKVGPIEEDNTFANNTKTTLSTKPLATQSGLSSAQNLPEYPVAEEWLRELLESGFSGDLARA